MNFFSLNSADANPLFSASSTKTKRIPLKSPSRKKLELNSRLTRGTPLKSPKVVKTMDPKTRNTKKITPCRDIKGPVTPLRKKQKVAAAVEVESPNVSKSPSPSRRSLRRTMDRSPIKSSSHKKSKSSVVSKDETLTSEKNGNSTKTPVRVSVKTATTTNKRFGGGEDVVVDAEKEDSPPPPTRSLKRTSVKMNKSHSTLSTTKEGAGKLNGSTLSRSRVAENKIENRDAVNTSIRKSPRKKIKVGLFSFVRNEFILLLHHLSFDYFIVLGTPVFLN